MANKEQEVTIYQMMVNNAARHIRTSNPNTVGNINAFHISEVMEILLCKNKAEIAVDIVKAGKKYDE